MGLSIFEDKTKTPCYDDLVKVLGTTFPIWKSIDGFVRSNYPEVYEEWKYGGKNYGWGFRLRDKKRVIVYLAPCDGYFKFSMVLGEKATKEVLGSNISQDVKKIIEEAPVYAEGRGFRIEVKYMDYLNDIENLILIKISN